MSGLGAVAGDIDDARSVMSSACWGGPESCRASRFDAVMWQPLETVKASQAGRGIFTRERRGPFSLDTLFIVDCYAGRLHRGRVQTAGRVGAGTSGAPRDSMGQRG